MADSAGKILNTGHTLYGNITRALSADLYKEKLIALDGGSSTTEQPNAFAVTKVSPYTFNAQQGITRDTSHWFGTSSSKIEKYDLTNTLITANNSPYASLPVGLDHLGDCCVDDDYLYVGASNWSGGSSTKKGVAVFDKSDLSYVDYINLDAYPDLEAAGVCISKDGTELLVCSFSWKTDTPAANKFIHRINKATRTHVGTYEVSEILLGVQGMDYSPEDDVYYVNTYPEVDVTSCRIVTLSTSFEVLARHDPVSTSTELEGVCCYGGINYLHEINDSPKEFSTNNVFVSKTEGDAINVIDNSLLADTGTLVLNLKVGSLFDYNTVFDNTESANSWESWINQSGKLFFRVNATTYAEISTPYLINRNDYVLAFSWDNVAGTVSVKIGVNGTYTSPVSAAWVAPPINGLWLAGQNAGNDRGNFVYRDLLLFDKVLSDVELLSVNNDFDTLYTTAALPAGTVTIGTITKTATTASIPFTYDDTGETGYEYRIDGGTAIAVASSPISLAGLTAETEYDVEVRAVNDDGAGAWSTLVSFTTEIITSLLNLTISGLASTTRSVDFYNDTTKAFIKTEEITFNASGFAAVSLPLAVGVVVTGRYLGNNPPTTGSGIYGVTV